MGAGLLTALFGAGPDDRTVECSYECTACETTYGEWQTACPECGQLVVRVVEPRPTGGVRLCGGRHPREYDRPTDSVPRQL